MADSAIFFDNSRRFAGMKDTIVLYAGAGTHDDGIAVLVGSYDGSPPNARFVTNGNVANQNSRGSNKRRGRDFRPFAFVLNNHNPSTSEGCAAYDMRRKDGKQGRLSLRGIRRGGFETCPRSSNL
jgi:hypothetical protein